MKQELQNKLFEKYPKIFVQRTLPMTHTCMCWGIECPDSWYDLLDNLCENIQNEVDSKKLLQVEASQVKEKFGSLRFYLNGHIESIEDMINIAEQGSRKICAECGSKEDVISTDSWIIFLCKDCRNK